MTRDKQPRAKAGAVIPYVIDNELNRLADVLNRLLEGHSGRAMDIATAYFNVEGFTLLKTGLLRLSNFRLLLGNEPTDSEALGLPPETMRRLRDDLAAAPYTRDLLREVEDLIAFLKRPTVGVRAYQDGFLHAKAYLFYGDSPVGRWDRFQPVAAVVGSSNFTQGGLTTNQELNLVHKATVDDSEAEDPLPTAIWPGEKAIMESASLPEKRLLMSAVGARAIADLDEWFRRKWESSRDYKQDLIDLLDKSKFGTAEYSPYQIYMKALFEYFRDELEGQDVSSVIRSALELTEFQDDAVKKARKILARYDGVVVADSVGLGKTWIGKKLLEDYAYHLRQKALVVCPASLREMWTNELRDATISAAIVSQEELGQVDVDLNAIADVDVVLVDESHNFRNKSAQRYENLDLLISLNGGRGRDGQRKKVILLTATPINNDIFDLYNQLNLFSRGDRNYFAAAGIGDLYRYFQRARRDRTAAQGGALFNLLEEVVIRRTRPFIKRAYPNAQVQGQPVHWPDRKLRTVSYDLEATYQGIYQRVVDAIGDLKLAPYRLESYKKRGVTRDEFEEGREEALVGIFKSRYLKRFESSVEAFRISVRRALEFLKTFESYLLEGKLLDSKSFQKALRYMEREDSEDDVTPRSLAEELDAHLEAQEFLESLPRLDATQYDLRALHEALQHDVDALTEIWHEVKDVGPSVDAKLLRLKNLLSTDLKGQKVILFTYFKDTARYLYRHLHSEEAEAWRQEIGNPVIRRMDSGASVQERSRLIQAFAPRANGHPDIAGTAEEVQILISTDVLSEGQNLQDCGVVLNYDLHWNPTRMVQRAGRVDRLLSPFETIWVYNMFPDEGLERLLGLVHSLNDKILDIDRSGFLDASVLGETVHPQNFNALDRIRKEDAGIVEEEEEFTELASNEFLLQRLRALIEAGGRDELEQLPDGIHSGHAKQGFKGIFFYFVSGSGAAKNHHWVYYDLTQNKIIDNRFTIANLIACSPDTPRVVGEVDVFEAQSKVIDFLVGAAQEQRAVEEAPAILDPSQQAVATLLRTYLSHPDFDRDDVLEAIQRLSTPLPLVHVKSLKTAYQAFVKTQSPHDLIGMVRSFPAPAPDRNGAEPRSKTFAAGDFHLVCFELISA